MADPKRLPGARRLQCLQPVQAYGTSTAVFSVGKQTAVIDYASDPRGVLVLGSEGEMHLVPWQNVAAIELERAK